MAESKKKKPEEPQGQDVESAEELPVLFPDMSADRMFPLIDASRVAIADANAYRDHCIKRKEEEPLLYAHGGTERVPSTDFRGHGRFMKKSAKRFIQREQALMDALYCEQPHRIPFNFGSNEEAEYHLQRIKARTIAREDGAPRNGKKVRKHLTLTEAVECFIESRLGATCMTFEGVDAPTLLMYDYDRKVYTFDQNFIARWLTILTGVARQNDLKSFVTTLQGLGDRLAIYNPLPRWKVAVGNGIYNTITRQLEEYTPRQVVINRIETNYNPSASQPHFVSGITFEKMVSDLANDKPERIELIMQMCKAIITGYSVTPAIFVAIGAGGDGKSVFMSLISQVIGASNTGSLNFTDMNDEPKVVEVAQKRLVVGMDNNHNASIRNTALLKSAASREVTSFNRKFMTAISLRFTGTIVQLCNNLPRFGESGSAIRRRIVTILCENSHYERGDENTNLAENIKNKHWHEYILKTILDEDTNPYFTDFNDCDRSVLNASLDTEDPIGSFFEDFAEVGVFNSGVEVLPRSLIYAVYQDWFANSYPGAQPVGARTFSTRSEGILREYGYSGGGDISPVRISTLSNDYNIDFEELLGYMANGERVQDLLKGSKTTRVVVRDPKIINVKTSTSRKGHRSPKKCDALVFFSMWDEVVSDIEYNPRSYEDIAKEMGLVFPIRDEALSVVEANTSYDVASDDDLDDYLGNSYSAYMAEKSIASLDNEFAVATHKDKGVSYGREMLSLVQEQARKHRSTIRPMDKKVAEAKEIDFVNDDELIVAEASVGEMLEHASEVASRVDSPEIARAFFSLNPDVSGAVRRGDTQTLRQISQWLQTASAVTGDNDLNRLALTSSTEKIVQQLRQQAVVSKDTVIFQKIVTSDELDSTTKIEMVREILDDVVQSLEGAKN